MVTLLGTYQLHTPGIAGADNSSVRLDRGKNRPQPDILLRIEEDCGGQAKVDGNDYLQGAPELVAEVAASSASYDLHEKLGAYQRNGVLKYVVWRVEEEAVDWFVLRRSNTDRYVPGRTGFTRAKHSPASGWVRQHWSPLT